MSYGHHILHNFQFLIPKIFNSIIINEFITFFNGNDPGIA
jgi:hypothetical protein